MKKYIKLIAFAFAMFFITKTSVFAKQMTINELGKEALELKKDNINYIYVIGKYAFTDKHKLTTQDIMLAARSIDTNDGDGEKDSDPIYNKMSVQIIRPIISDDDQISGWKPDDSLFGENNLTTDKKIDIRYIDYKFYPEESKAEIKTEIPKDEVYTNSLKSLSFEGGNASHSQNLEYKNGKLIGLLLKHDAMEDKVFSGNDKTGYYFAFVLEVPDAKEETTVELKGAKNTKMVTYSNFDIKNDKNKTPGLLVLWSVDPNTEKDEKKVTITVDIDGSGVEYEADPYVIDYSDINFQTQTTANIKVDGSKETTDIPFSDRLQLSMWGYKFPDDLKLSEENSHKKDSLSYDSESGKLTGAIKEQKLTGGFDDADLDSYFYTFTIRPDKVTEDIKVTIKNGEDKEKEFKYKDFTVDGDSYVLTVLQHISKSEKASGNKVITITIDSDGDENDYYIESKEYKIDYSDVEFIDLHTVTYNDNNGSKSSTEDIYDGEKLQKPEDPTRAKHEVDDNQYNTFNHWNIQVSDTADHNSDTEFEFDTTNKSTEPITEDITLYPIWEVDVNQYIKDAITHVNEKESIKDKFKIETTEDEHTLNVEILNRDTKLNEITDTAIADAIAHALASGEVDSIELKLGTNEKELEANGNTNEEEIKTQVISDLKDFFEKEVEDKDNQTLSDLYDKWSMESGTKNKLQLSIIPVQTVAQFKGKDAGAGEIYEFTIEKELMVKFDAGTLTDPSTQYVKTGEGITKDQLPTIEIPEKEKAYRTFDGWYEDSNPITELSDVRTDKELTAHYKLNVDKFIQDVVSDLDDDKETSYSNNFHDEFDVKKDKNNITITLNSPNVSLTELAETSIPGTLAYILQKGEIKNITLSTDKQTDTFNKTYTSTNKEYNDSADRDETLLGSNGVALKKEIINGAKKLFNDELNSHEKKATLDQLEYDNKSFKIKVGDPIETIKLVNSEDEEMNDETEKTYTFTFDANFAVVNKTPESTLGATDISAVLGKDEYSTIYVDGNYPLDTVLNIEKDITIKSVTSDEKSTLSITNQDFAIDVKSGNVNISDLKIAGGKKSEIKVEKNANLTVNNIDISDLKKSDATDEENKDIPNSGILVEGTLNASNIINSKETYDTPAIAILYGAEYNKLQEYKKDSSASVQSSNMTMIESYNKVTKGKEVDKAGIYYGAFYYVNPNHTKLYVMGVQDEYRKTSGIYDFIKFYYYDDTIDLKEMGYEEGKTPDDATKAEGKVFDCLEVINTKRCINLTDKVQDVLLPNNTTIVTAKYRQGN